MLWLEHYRDALQMLTLGKCLTLFFNSSFFQFLVGSLEEPSVELLILMRDLLCQGKSFLVFSLYFK